MPLGSRHSHQHLVRDAEEGFSMGDRCCCPHSNEPTFEVSWVFNLRPLHSIGFAPVVEDLALTAMFFHPRVNEVGKRHVCVVCEVEYLRCTFLLFLLPFSTSLQLQGLRRLLLRGCCCICSRHLRESFLVIFCRRQKWFLLCFNHY